MGKRKHRRINREQRDIARRLVGLWYVGQCERREEKYRSVNAVPVSPSGTVRQLSDRWKAWTSEYIQRSSNLTANGKERHLPNLKAPALTTPMDINSKGGFRSDKNLIFAVRVMRHVMAVDPASHAALEMDAAGYDRQGIAEELQCGERLAETFRDAGLSVVTSCILLRHELGWTMHYGNKPNPYT